MTIQHFSFDCLTKIWHLNFYCYDLYFDNHFILIVSLFQATELISTAVVLHLANNDNAVTQRKILCIIGIALLHILASGVDQFISNVIHGEGYAHQASCTIYPSIHPTNQQLIHIPGL